VKIYPADLAHFSHWVPGVRAVIKRS
jgi:hypothetical protein